MSFICSICLELLASPSTANIASSNSKEESPNARDIVTTRCGHMYHRKCLEDWVVQQRPNGTCPTCKARVTKRSMLRLFPPESDENLELQLQLEKETVRDLKEKLKANEDKLLEMERTAMVRSIAHDLCRLEFNMKEIEVRNLQRQNEKILFLHHNSSCTEKMLRKRKRTSPVKGEPGEVEVVDITGSDDETDSFTPLTLPPGDGYCIETRDMKSGARTFINITLDGSGPWVNTPAPGVTPRTHVMLGKFYVGTFDGAPASLANVRVSLTYFQRRPVTHEMIVDVFTNRVCDMLDDKGGLKIDILHVHIMKDLKICTSTEGKENLKSFETVTNENLLSKDEPTPSTTAAPQVFKKIRPGPGIGKADSAFQTVEITID